MFGFMKDNGIIIFLDADTQFTKLRFWFNFIDNLDPFLRLVKY